MVYRKLAGVACTGQPSWGPGQAVSQAAADAGATGASREEAEANASGDTYAHSDPCGSKRDGYRGKGGGQRGKSRSSRHRTSTPGSFRNPPFFLCPSLVTQVTCWLAVLVGVLVSDCR